MNEPAPGEAAQTKQESVAPADSLTAVSTERESVAPESASFAPRVESDEIDAILAEEMARTSRLRSAQRDAFASRSKRKTGATVALVAGVLGLAIGIGSMTLLDRRPTETAEVPSKTAEPAPVTRPAMPHVTAPAESHATPPKEPVAKAAEPPEKAERTAIDTTPAQKAAPSRSTTANSVTNTKAKAEPVVSPSLETKDLGPSATKSGDLGLAMREAVGPRASSNAAKETNEGASGARQVRPPVGAVVSAINLVLPAARACLGPGDSPRSGEIVFKNTGSVAKVAVGGDQRADVCIRGALSKARIEPFLDDTFSARVTVRP